MKAILALLGIIVLFSVFAFFILPVEPYKEYQYVYNSETDTYCYHYDHECECKGIVSQVSSLPPKFVCYGLKTCVEIDERVCQ